MLEKFRKAKAAEIAALQSLAEAGALPPPYTGRRPPFRAALEARAGRAVIAEYKRASPSRGAINLTLDPETAAAAYALAGAGAISVLTEEKYFQGNMAHLSRMTGPGLPLLRKDFLLHPLQADQTAAGPASALLLIARFVKDHGTLQAILRRALDLGLEVVAEIFDTGDLAQVRRAGASIIQVNNRDLDRLKVDITRSRRLIGQKRHGEFWISASGIDHPDLLDELLGLGFDAALTGSALMREQDPGKALAVLLRKER